MRNTVNGTYTGDGTNAVVFDIGFRPSKVEIFNVTDGDVYIHGLDDGSAGKWCNIGAAAAALTSNPPLLNNRGFSTGTNAAVIESAKVYLWVAHK
jgi:hypothetical protein